MLDFLRDLTKSDAERRQEMLNAYLDDALSPRQRRQFEANLDEDIGLQTELEQLRLLKADLRQLPNRPAPRNFTLDPALYGRPATQRAFQAYPIMRTATVLTAFFFILAIAFEMISFSGGSFDDIASAPMAAEVQMIEETAEEELTYGEEAAADTAVLSEEEAASESAAVADEGLAEEAFEQNTASDMEALAEDEAAEALEADEESDTPLAAEALDPPSAPSQESEASADEEDEATSDGSTTADASETSLPAPTNGADGSVVGAESANTAVIEATPTQSSLPRVTPVVPQERAAEATTNSSISTTPTPTPTIPVTPLNDNGVNPLPLSSLRWIQISLGLALLLFTTITLWLRQRL